MWEWLVDLALEHGALFTIFIAGSVTVAMTILRVKFVDQEKMLEWQREVSRWEAEKERARRTGDKKLWAKVKKQEARINQLKSKLAAQMGRSFIVMFIPMIVLMFLWPTLVGFYGSDPMVFIPGLPWSGEPIGIPFWAWYIICSYFIGTISSKIISPTGGRRRRERETGGPARVKRQKRR
ncbi:DUF106 domain-containing protein [Candidatus Bathyarchaeota archaeon]|nr:MAG: DUF106 domain-containing protein [Candidatus Bathyarchaeota archaeon]